MSVKLTIPVYVDHHSAQTGNVVFRARPLFIPEWDSEEVHVREDRALIQLQKKVEKSLEAVAIEPQQRDLLPWTFCPQAILHKIRLRIELRRQTFEGNFAIAVFESAGRRLALLTRGEGLTFEWPSSTRLEDLAQRVLTAHLRQLEKESDESLDPSAWFCGTQPHVGYIQVSLKGNQRLAVERTRMQAMDDDAPMDGGRELRKTGRCLNEVYPRGLQTALLREPELKELLTHFSHGKSRKTAMVLLVGPGRSGKTALIHECLRRRLEAEDGQKGGKFWHISPQRVISGMSYLGQWEKRWTAMLAEAKKSRHVLVFDDLLGLFEAGRTSSSDLSLAQVLKARQEHEPVSILAEATPEIWGRLRELDRSFASMFTVIHVRAMAEEETVRILVRTLQHLENEKQMQLDPEVLPLIMRLQARFGRALAFPGKAVEMLASLAASFANEPGGTLSPARLLEWFASRQGIRLAMIDPAQSLTAAALRSFFASRIMGQTEAVEAMIQTVLLARAQINDPEKPAGCLLFLGPTGVGKTESAKALAEFVYGGEDKMLRFDLNEYAGSDAAARLTGGPGQSGLLTAQVRRQPFSLLLFDEVEKAHPDVFDLLLQVLGEGRLTDALGLTTDFRNCIIILTSNLGVRNVRRRLGFEPQAAVEADVYREAAEKFFRPEFFNRLDRIVPFHELRPEDIGKLAAHMSSRALERQGLRDRRVEVRLDPQAVRFLAERGHDPEYGARALRRAVEAHLVEPLAASLGTVGKGGAVEIHVTLRNGALVFDPQVRHQANVMIAVPGQLSPEQLMAVVDEAHACLNEVYERLDSWDLGKKEDGLSPVQAWYYRLCDEAGSLREKLDQTERSFESMEKARRRIAGSRGTKPFIEALAEDLAVLPPPLMANLFNELTQSDMSPQAVSARLQGLVPMSLTSATVLSLLWQSRRLLDVATLEAMAPETVVFNNKIKEWLAPWQNDAFVNQITELAETTVLEGHGIRQLAQAMAGMDAHFHHMMFLHETRLADEPAETQNITHLSFESHLLDLRTGLCVGTENGVPVDLALAYAYAFPMPF